MMELPDLDDAFKVIDNLLTYSKELNVLKVEIKDEESNIMGEAFDNEDYYVKGKPPSVTYVENRWYPAGFDGSLKQKRLRVAELEALIDYHKNTLDFIKIQIDIWRTVQADKRGATL
jgi:hypothetical protein